MNEEQIIRDEAKEFYEQKISDSGYFYAHQDIHELKIRLDDFYTSESKAIFLDQIDSMVKEDLKKYIKEYRNSNNTHKSQYETKAEKILFYIKQEIETLPIIAHQKFQTNETAQRNKVFVSYCHLDKNYLIDVQRHFKPFLNLIDYWDDSLIMPGQKWKEEIKDAISKTKVAILLISTDFLGSEFIVTNELPPLLSAAEKDGAVILTVILKPCLFEEFNDINQFQAMNSPSRPVTKMDYDEKEELFVNLVRQTKRILER